MLRTTLALSFVCIACTLQETAAFTTQGNTRQTAFFLRTNTALAASSASFAVNVNHVDGCGCHSCRVGHGDACSCANCHSSHGPVCACVNCSVESHRVNCACSSCSNAAHGAACACASCSTGHDSSCGCANCRL
jgi:hypothetical protein